MFCKFCGAQLGDGVKFCTACGKPTSSAPVPPPSAPAPKPTPTPAPAGGSGKKKLILIAAATAVVIALIVAAVLLLGKGDERDLPEESEPPASTEDVRRDDAPTPAPSTTSGAESSTPAPIPSATPSTPSPAPSAPPSAEPKVRANLLDEYDSASYEEFNTFLSNFAEQCFTTYDGTNPDLDSVLRFAFLQLKYNSSALYYEGSEECLPADDVHRAVDRFFGLTLSPQSSADGLITYADGVYRATAADGESIAFVAVADELFLQSDGKWYASFTIYEVDEGALFSAGLDYSTLYGYDAEEAASSPILVPFKSCFARLDRHLYKDKESWMLLSCREG